MLWQRLRKKESSLEPETKLFLYNTLSTQKEEFIPLTKNKVTMYSCGPTVYDYVHIGNLRSYIFADILKRTLIFHGYDVTHTINLTDFGHLTDDGDAGEDKMMKGLKREGLPVTLTAMRELSDRYIKAFEDDYAALRILPPTTWSRASDYIRAQIRLIETLDAKGYTYETSDGVYFSIEKFPAYGALGNISIAEQRSGARVTINTEKHHPADFAVWKKGLLGWDSRWGKGFPGWHIECSAMAMATLGKQIDIHTGGIDHIPVHHNAEIAQCECATGKQFTRYWLHNEFITIDQTKISKSLGNSITMRHLVERGFTGEDYRYLLLTSHYRSPVNFTWEALTAAKQALFRLRRYVYEDYKQQAGVPNPTYLERFRSYLADDLDTPSAIALTWELTKDRTISDDVKCATLHVFDTIFDLGLRSPLYEGVRTLGVLLAEEVPDDVRTLVGEREAARLARNWLEADMLREKINLRGFTVEDTPQGPKISTYQGE